MKQCSTCGNFVEDNAKFCNSCGQSITEPMYNQSQQPNYSQPQQPSYNQPQQPNYNQQQQPNYNQQQAYNAQPTYYNNGQMNTSTSKATASLVLGILSFFFFGIILSIIGFVLGNSYLKNPMSNPAGFGMAKAGKICSLISMILWIVIIAIYIIFFIVFAGTAAHYSYSYYY